MRYRVYILRCSDGSYYVGRTDDLEARIRCHGEGHGPVYTRVRLPVTLAYSEGFPTLRLAMARERQLKRWSHRKKSALVKGDKSLLRDLSRSRD